MTLLSPSTESQPISPSRQLLGLSAVLVAVWLALAGPAVWYSGFRGREGRSWAVGLSLVPGLLVVALQSAVPVLSTNPHAVMVASAIRMLFVLQK